MHPDLLRAPVGVDRQHGVAEGWLHLLRGVAGLRGGGDRREGGRGDQGCGQDEARKTAHTDDFRIFAAGCLRLDFSRGAHELELTAFNGRAVERLDGNPDFTRR
jgi:hypothetical protein